MGLLDFLLGIFVADRITTIIIFAIMFLAMIGLVVCVFIFDPGALNDSNASVTDDDSHHYELKIITDGKWEGSVSSKDVNMDDISGKGDKKIDLGNSKASDINIDISKSDSSSKELTVKLYSDGKVVDSDTAEMPDEKILVSP
ncbi:hypothetical protein [Methanobrevibacter sp.]|uniref:hypothetical protein n=1 Tax=Methanobrevibacter sp. TaxID=66852 RepID=UPI00386CB3D2